MGDVIPIAILAMAAFLLAMLVWIAARLIRFIKRVGPTGCAQLLFPYPPRIHLIPSPIGDWRKPARTGTRIQSVSGLGFDSIQFWKIAGMDDWRICTLMHAEHGLTAVIHEAEHVGTWTTIIHLSTDPSKRLAYSNALDRSNMIWLPPNQQKHLPGMSEEEMMTRLSEHLGRRSVLKTNSIDPDKVSTQLESLFAQASDYRIKEGFSDFEVQEAWKKHCTECEPMTSKQIRITQSIIHETIKERIVAACISELGNNCPLPAHEWRESMPRFLVISEQTDLRILSHSRTWSTVNPGMAVSSSQVRRQLRKVDPTSDGPRLTFSRFNSALPPRLRYTLLGSVDSPVPADIYCGPAPVHKATPIRKNHPKSKKPQSPTRFIG